MLKSAITNWTISSHHRRRIIKALQTQCSSLVVNFTRNESQASTSIPIKDGETHFGFQTVKESEKADKVHKVFEEVAKSYDLMNDAMSFGVHRVWKDIFIERLGATKGTRLLDMAGGTGKIVRILFWSVCYMLQSFYVR